jgi:hypothetical protein
MIIESVQSEVKLSINDVFNFVQDLTNLIHLLPQDKVSNWEATSQSCSFKIQGGIIIPLKLRTTTFPNQIILDSGEKSPFPFVLTIYLQELSSTSTKGQLIFDAKMGKTLQFIAEKPLRNLFNTMSERLKLHFDLEK